MEKEPAGETPKEFLNKYVHEHGILPDGESIDIFEKPDSWKQSAENDETRAIWVADILEEIAESGSDASKKLMEAHDEIYHKYHHDDEMGKN